MSSISAICIKKDATLHSFNISSSIKPDEIDLIHIPDTFTKSKGTNELTRECDYSYLDYNISIYAWTEGRAGNENKFELPPPIDNELYFGNIYAVAHRNDKLIKLDIKTWDIFYESAFGGFDDLGSEDSYSEDDNDDEDADDMKDFIVDDDYEESEDKSYNPSDESSESLSDEEYEDCDEESDESSEYTDESDEESDESDEESEENIDELLEPDTDSKKSGTESSETDSNVEDKDNDAKCELCDEDNTECICYCEKCGNTADICKCDMKICNECKNEILSCECVCPECTEHIDLCTC